MIYPLLFVDGLVDLVMLLKDWIMSAIHTLTAFISTVSLIVQQQATISWWFPNFAFNILVFGTLIIVILRLLGR